MDTLTEWVASVEGRYLDVDGAAGPQCWDAVQAYLTAFNLGTLWTVPGATRFRGYAAGSVEGYGVNGLERVFDLVPGTQPGVPGDVVVWAFGQPSYPTSHNGVLLEDRGATLLVVSQNSSPVEPSAPGYNPDAVRAYGTTGPTRTQLLPRGECWFLRPKTASPTPTPIPTPVPAPVKGPPMAPFNLDRLADVARKYGLQVIEEPGWDTRGFLHQDLQGYGGHLVHHTASNRASYLYNAWPSGNILVNGRSDLPGPLCNASIDRNGVIRIVATGVANHAGTGYAMGIVPRNMGNHYLLGTEIESSGVAPFDMTQAQMSAAIMFGAAIEIEFGQGLSPENRLQIFHLEYSDAGKIDLFGWPGGPDGYRASVNDMISQINRAGAAVTPPPKARPRRTRQFTVGPYGANLRRATIRLLDSDIRMVLPPGSKITVRGWKYGLDPDGPSGPMNSVWYQSDKFPDSWVHSSTLIDNTRAGLDKVA